MSLADTKSFDDDNMKKSLTMKKRPIQEEKKKDSVERKIVCLGK